jgi:hypothetical protein
MVEANRGTSQRTAPQLEPPLSGRSLISTRRLSGRAVYLEIVIDDIVSP